MANAAMMDDRKRAMMEMRVMEGLRQLDDSTLKDLEQWLAQPVVEGAPRTGASGRGLTRRQAIVGTVLGAAGIAGAGAAGTYLGQSDAVQEGARAIASANDTIQSWQERANALGARLEEAGELINLFDRLENVGLDSVVSAGLSAVASALGGAIELAQGLREGLQVARNNINQLDQGLAVLDNGLDGVEGAVTRLSGLMQGLEDRLRAAGEPVSPVTDALGSFFTGLISKIPFGVGDRILETIDRIQAVIGAIPESIENINRDLIAPLRQTFFPREGESINVRLLDPLTALIFTPAERMLSGLAALAETWQTTLEQPALEKIEARKEIRKEIAAFRGEKSL